MDTKDMAIYAENVKKKVRLGVLDRRAFREDVSSKFSKGKTQDSSQYLMAVDGVSFVIKKGERVGLIGRNGAGKSTLLKMICRITEPTEGFIGVNGRVTSMLEIGVGFHSELTGKDNIYLSGSILGMSKSEIDERLDEIIAFSGLEEFMDTPVKRYSTGMYLRLAFAVSAHLRADIVILDEVLAVGDLEFQKKCIATMKEIALEEQRTVLYVSHNMETVKELCNRCLVMDKGKIVFDGPVEESIAVYKKLMAIDSDSLEGVENAQG